MQDRKASEKQIGCLPGDLFPKWGNGLAEFLRSLSYLTLIDIKIGYVEICVDFNNLLLANLFTDYNVTIVYTLSLNFHMCKRGICQYVFSYTPSTQPLE